MQGMKAKENNHTSRQPLSSMTGGDVGGTAVAESFICCGQHAVCEKELLMKAAAESIDYFDDEELDRFRGRRPDAYTDEEEEEFREVLYTTLAHEVSDWLRSLQLRGIELPEGVRDEALMLAEESFTAEKQ